MKMKPLNIAILVIITVLVAVVVVANVTTPKSTSPASGGSTAQAEPSAGSSPSAYDIQTELIQMQSSGKMSAMDGIIWNTVPRLPANKQWANPYGDKLIFEETLKDTIARQSSQLSDPVRKKLLQLQKVYQQRGLQ